MAYIKNKVTGTEKAKQFGLMQFYFVGSLILVMTSVLLNFDQSNRIRNYSAYADTKEGWNYQKFLYKFYIINDDMSDFMIGAQVVGHLLDCVLFLISCFKVEYNFTKILQLAYPQWGTSSAWRKLLGLCYCCNLILLGFSLQTWGTAGVVAVLHLTSIILWNKYWETLDIAMSAGMRKEAAESGWIGWNCCSFFVYFPVYGFTVVAKNMFPAESFRCVDQNCTILEPMI